MKTSFSIPLVIGSVLLLAGATANATVVTNIANGDVAALKAAISTANTNGDADVINLAAKGTYILTTVDNATNGPNGLPVIVSDGPHSLTINGNGATITRSAAQGTPSFRIGKINSGIVTISVVTISNGLLNSGTTLGDRFGAGLSIKSGTVALSYCNFLSNVASGDTGSGPSAAGGAIFNSSNGLTLANCYLDSNSATGGDQSNGGGIYNTGPLTVRDSTLSNNATGGLGGGILTFTTLTVTNSTIASNSAQSGGGIADANPFGGAQLVLTNDTISANFLSGSGDSTGGGVAFGADSTVELRNTIIAGNGGGVSGPDIAGSNAGTGLITSHGHNLIGTISNTSGWLATDLTGTDDHLRNPKLGLLLSNGGPAPTMALLSTSEAIDGGDDSVLGSPLNLTSDERGFPRRIGSHVDIGALEQDAAQTGNTFTVNTTLDDKDGACGETRCTLRDALDAANAATGANEVRFAPKVSGTIRLTRGELLITDSVTLTGPGARTLTVDANLAGRILRINTSGTTKATISGLTFTRGQLVSTTNDAALGGGISTNATTTLTQCTISDSSAVGRNTSSAGTPADSASGGGIYNGGTLTLIDCTLRGNSAIGSSITAKSSSVPGAAGEGGGIFNAGTLTLQNCTLNGNTALGGHGGNNTLGGQGGGGGTGTGGAIDVLGNSATMTNCTLSGNTATGGTGGLGSPSGAKGAGTGGGIHVEPPFMSTRDSAFAGNTIIAGNSATTGPDVSGAVVSQGSNLVGKTDGSTGFTASGDKTDAMATPLNIGSLANNGGPTDTMALLAGSTAIDAGNDAKALPTDQRGAARVGASDIGAFEFGSVAPTPTPTPKPTPTPTPTATPKPTATPNGTPTATPKATITPTATPKPSPTATPHSSATPTATPRRPTLGNISTRLRVETGDNVLIGGFIITGTQPKKVILRAIGPSLPVSDALQNPLLELHGPNGSITINDNWIDAPNKQAIIDTTVAPSNNLESAILTTLPAHNSAYTAVVRGVTNGTGVGLVEVFDLDRSVDSELANISTRGLVQTGENVMIGGFIVLNGKQKVIVRAIGPSLPVAGALQDPVLELHDGNGAVMQANDNWRTGGQEAEIIATTVPPSDDRESAIVRTLAPGNYTAVVRGVNNTIGVALVEVYALK
jgi:CSLREA domain-containing protein